MATLADKIQGLSTTPQYNPDAVHWNYSELIALLVELKVYEFKPSKTVLMNIGYMLRKLKNMFFKSDKWNNRIAHISDWHRKEMASFLATELSEKFPTQESLDKDVSSQTIAENLMEIESLLSNSGANNPKLLADVKKDLDVVGLRRSAGQTFKPTLWKEIVTGKMFDTPDSESWCEKCRALEQRLLISRLFPGCYIKESSDTSSEEGETSSGTSSDSDGETGDITASFSGIGSLM